MDTAFGDRILFDRGCNRGNVNNGLMLIMFMLIITLILITGYNKFLLLLLNREDADGGKCLLNQAYQL